MVACGFLMAPTWAADATDTWMPSAPLPSGGAVARLAIDPVTPTTLYAVSDPGLYVTTDSGAHWTLSLSLSMQAVDDVAVSSDGAVVYAAANYYGVYKSTDAGQTWTQVNHGLPVDCEGLTDNVMRVFVDPTDDDVAYASTLNTCASQTPAYGLYKTTDGGSHWVSVNNGIGPGSGHNLQQSGVDITGLAVDPSDDQVLYLSVYASNPNNALSGVYKSVDQGAHWTQALSSLRMGTVAVDPGNSQDVYAMGTDGTHLSTDGGATWNHTGVSGQPWLAGKIIFDAANTQHLWATNASVGGLYESVDGGANFTSIDSGRFGSADAVVDPSNHSNVFVASQGYGVGCSIDGGTTWNACTTGIENVTVTNLLVGTDGAFYLATAGTGIFKSIDQGATWIESDSGIGSGAAVDVLQFVADPNDADTLYAATTSGLYRTSDGAATWTLLTGSLPHGPAVSKVTIAPEDSDLLYVQGWDVYKSTDGGATWNPATGGLSRNTFTVNSIVVDPQDERVAYLGGGTTDGGTGLYKTTDGGGHWTRLGGLPDNSDVYGIAIDPKHPQVLYAGGNFTSPVPGQPGWTTTDGLDIYKSNDGGATWADSSTGIEPGVTFDHIEVDSHDSDYVYAKGMGSGPLYASGDGGATWNLLSLTGAAANTAVRKAAPLSMDHPGPGRTPASAGAADLSAMTIAVDPRNKAVLYGAATGGGMYVYHYVPWDVQASSSGSGGKPTNSAGGSSGGGGMPLLLDLLLLGFAAWRRRK